MGLGIVAGGGRGDLTEDELGEGDGRGVLRVLRLQHGHGRNLQSVVRPGAIEMRERGASEAPDGLWCVPSGQRVRVALEVEVDGVLRLAPHQLHVGEGFAGDPDTRRVGGRSECSVRGGFGSVELAPLCSSDGGRSEGGVQ
jgi:hypothetical protein